jgi:hypothetical protein
MGRDGEGDAHHNSSDHSAKCTPTLGCNQAAGYADSPLCSACLPGYIKDWHKGSCTRSDGPNFARLVLYALGLLVFVLYLYLPIGTSSGRSSMAILTIALNFSQFVSKIRHKSNISEWAQALLTEQYGAPMAAATGLHFLPQYAFILLLPLVAMMMAALVGIIEHRCGDRIKTKVNDLRGKCCCRTCSPEAGSMNDGSTAVAHVAMLPGNEEGDMSPRHVSVGDAAASAMVDLRMHIVEVQGTLGVHAEGLKHGRVDQDTVSNTKAELKKLKDELEELRVQQRSTVGHISPLAKVTQCIVVILIYTFTQNLTFSCYALGSFPVYDDELHLLQMPNVLWGSSEHHYLLGWAITALILWCGGAFVALGIFTIAGERRLPHILRGAGGKFLKAHYRPGYESFELMYMFRRIALTLTAILVVNEITELVIINGILFIFGLVHFWMRPFRDNVHNYIEAVSVVLLFVLYDVETALVTLNMDGGSISLMLDVVEVAGVLIFIPFLLRDVRVYFRKLVSKFCLCGRQGTAAQRRGSLHEGLLGDVHLSNRNIRIDI